MKIFGKTKELFDNSDYSKESKYYDDSNKKIIGKFKDEAAGVPITEFVGLNQKCIATSKTITVVVRQVVRNQKECHQKRYQT